eukprot:s1365_g27.t1
MLNGVFGVPKGDKVTPEGLPILRLIMDLRCTNYCMRQIEGDVSHLTGATTFQRLLVEMDEDLLISGEDPTSASPRPQSSRAAMKVQCGTYLDDTTILERVEKGLTAELEGTPAQEQQQLRLAYEWWGIPTNANKSLQRASDAERLGALIDGKSGTLRTRSKRSLDLFWLGSWIRSQEVVPRKALQVYAGKAVHILQFRRCLFSIMDVIFVAIARSGEMVTVTPELAEEMMLLEVMLPLAQFNLRAKVDPVVTCSDASESGGAMCFSSRLTRTGQEEAERMILEGIPPEVGN